MNKSEWNDLTTGREQRAGDEKGPIQRTARSERERKKVGETGKK